MEANKEVEYGENQTRVGNAYDERSSWVYEVLVGLYILLCVTALRSYRINGETQTIPGSYEQQHEEPEVDRGDQL